MADSLEQPSQPQEQEQASKRQRLGLKIGGAILGVGAAIGLPIAALHGSGEARPTPEASASAPADKISPLAQGEIPEDMQDAYFKDVQKPVTKSTQKLLAVIPEGTPSVNQSVTVDGKPGQYIFAGVVADTNQIVVEANGGEGAPHEAPRISVTYKVDATNPILSDTQTSVADFRTAISDPATLLTDISVSTGSTAIGVHGGENRVNFYDGPGNTPTMRTPEELQEYAITFGPQLEATVTQLTTR